LAELVHEVLAAARALDSFAGIAEDALDLLVELIPVGDDGDARVRVVLEDPFGEEYHDDAFAAALRVSAPRSSNTRTTSGFLFQEFAAIISGVNPRSSATFTGAPASSNSRTAVRLPLSAA
jgi:hypothetical protein